MFAVSKTERRPKFRKFAKSVLDWLPDPSAILFVILSVGAAELLRKSEAFAFLQSVREVKQIHAEVCRLLPDRQILEPE